MVKFLAAGRSGWTLDIQQNWIDTTSERPTIDPKWRATDNNGHEHFYEGHAYPTLDYIIDAEHWCDGTEGIALHDPHMAVDESHYECLICREVVKPGSIPGGTPSSIPGSVSGTLRGLNSAGVTVTLSLIEEEATAIQTADEANRDAVVLRLLDEAPERRIISMERTR